MVEFAGKFTADDTLGRGDNNSPHGKLSGGLRPGLQSKAGFEHWRRTIPSGPTPNISRKQTLFDAEINLSTERKSREVVFESARRALRRGDIRLFSVRP
jgi:hypothetical protein